MHLGPTSERSADRQLRQACMELENGLRAGSTRCAEDLLAAYPEVAADVECVLELVFCEYDTRRRMGQQPRADEWYSRFPALRDRLQRLFELDGVFQTRSGTEVAASDTPFSVASGKWETATDGIRRHGDYELLGEVGRGGMGVVYRARDRDLKRELAVKLLADDYRDDAGARQRFIEEARIAGQLQHPGIVPIHELGELVDGRPYFTMKLIEGRTLAALLDVRNDPTEDRPRFLKVFEAVCQTVAYAHSRGVIHRDLKPANVMVGAFGEVQVMDWGLAKVLGEKSVERRSDGTVAPIPEADTGATLLPRAASQDGTVLGTMAYMAPEQAQGRNQELDQRCDVFGLGAILCEILTGRPPLAATGELEYAICRLDECGADAELIALAKQCLADEPSDRPRDAGVVAAELRRYLESVEARLHQAELERAQAQAKATEERKRRRITAMLAAAVVALIVMVGGGAWWLDHQRSTREAEFQRQQAETERTVHGLLREADLLQRQDKLTEALAAIRQAEGRLEGNQGNEQSRKQVSEVRLHLELLNSINDIRLTSAELQPDASLFDPKRSRPLYREAFRKYGIDVANDDAAAIASKVRGKPGQTLIEGAMLDWAVNNNTAERAPLLQALDALDDDTESGTWRSQLRAAVGRGDNAAIQTLAKASPPAQTLPPTTLEWVGRVLYQHGTPVESLRWMKQAHQIYPQDFWIQMTLAGTLIAQNPPQRAEALRHYTAALALRPQNPAVLYNIGNSLTHTRQLTEAVPYFERAIHFRPNFAEAHTNLGAVITDLGRPADGVRHHEIALRLQPDNTVAHTNLGYALWQLGRHDEAITSYRTGLRLQPENNVLMANLGAALAEVGELQEAAAILRRACELGPNRPVAHLNWGNTLLLLNEHVKAETVLQKSVKLNPNFTAAHIVLGDVHREQGRFADALADFRRAEKLLRPNDPLTDQVRERIAPCEQLLDLDGRMTAIQSGETPLTDPAAKAAFAQLLACKQKHETAAQCYLDAFSAHPSLATDHLHQAARCAAQAASGRSHDGKSLDEATRSRWLRQATDWLAAELSDMEQRLESDFAKAASDVRRTLRGWQQDPALALLRDLPTIGSERAEDREICRKLWAKVESLLVGCRQK